MSALQQNPDGSGQFARIKLELAAWLDDGGPCCEAGYRTFPDDCPWHGPTREAGK